MLAFLGERHRFSEVLFGLEATPLSGWAISLIRSIRSGSRPFCFRKSLSGDINGPLAFAIGGTELFRCNGAVWAGKRICDRPSVSAAWLVTLTTWQLFGVPPIVTSGSSIPITLRWLPLRLLR
jgi:hypothetical protein